MDFCRLVIYFALAVSFVSGKINVTINIFVLHRLLSVVFRILSLGQNIHPPKKCAADQKRNLVTVLNFLKDYRFSYN